jgi:hypothetical protein
LHSTKWSDGKKKKGWKPFPSKKNSIQDSEGNEENEYTAPDANKTMTNDTKEPSDAHKNTLKEKILQEITRIHGEDNRHS